tara:strand:+ start:28822 stop:29820 length:999 start_codon:yes stop_codon:yes gene_type:complete
MILITGGAGYIGSHTALSLLEYGHEIIVIDSLENSSIEVIKRLKAISGKSFPFYQCDIRDQIQLESIFIENDIKTVIHFAGLKSISESNKYPIVYFDNNVNGFISLIKTMQNNNIKNIVFSSSATVYGLPDKLPIKEDAKLSALNPYGRTKLMIENILNDIYESDSSWNISILRYFNPVGAHESGLIGEDPKNTPTNLFPLVSLVAAGQQDFLRVYGNDYLTPDGTGVRDYIHVSDLAKGHLSALKIFKKNGSKHVLNLGTGKGFSVLEIIKEFENISNKKIPYKIQERRQGDAPTCYADVSYAHSLMNWSAEKSLKKMCQDQWRWQNNNNH